MDEVRKFLSLQCVCTSEGSGLTAEFPLRDGAVSAAMGDHHTALWQLAADHAHPEMGGGLFCLLEMPHQVKDEKTLAKLVTKLNQMEWSTVVSGALGKRRIGIPQCSSWDLTGKFTLFIFPLTTPGARPRILLPELALGCDRSPHSGTDPLGETALDPWLDDPFPDYETEPSVAFSAS